MRQRRIVKSYGNGGLHITLSTRDYILGEQIIVIKVTELERLIEKKIEEKLKQFLEG